MNDARVITRLGGWVSKPGEVDTDPLEYLVVIKMCGMSTGGYGIDASYTVYDCCYQM